MKVIIMSLVAFLFATGAWAKGNKASRHTEVQKHSYHAHGHVEHVNFDEANINGTARNPDGAYVLQKRAVKFVPLYHIKHEFDQDIKDSIQYVR